MPFYNLRTERIEPTFEEAISGQGGPNGEYCAISKYMKIRWIIYILYFVGWILMLIYFINHLNYLPIGIIWMIAWVFAIEVMFIFYRQKIYLKYKDEHEKWEKSLKYEGPKYV